jgi:hypothetical protein
VPRSLEAYPMTVLATEHCSFSSPPRRGDLLCRAATPRWPDSAINVGADCMRESLRQFGPEIWMVDGPVVSFYGFRYPTRMAVIRLSNGSLFVWSPVALPDSLRSSVDALGRVRRLVSPNALHHLFLWEWKTAYPAGASAPRRGCGASAKP